MTKRKKVDLMATEPPPPPPPKPRTEAEVRQAIRTTKGQREEHQEDCPLCQQEERCPAALTLEALLADDLEALKDLDGRAHLRRAAHKVPLVDGKALTEPVIAVMPTEAVYEYLDRYTDLEWRDEMWRTKPLRIADYWSMDRAQLQRLADTYQLQGPLSAKIRKYK